MNDTNIWTEKFRPIRFDDVVGQQEIITDMRWYALEQAKQGKPIKDKVTWCNNTIFRNPLCYHM